MALPSSGPISLDTIRNYWGYPTLSPASLNSVQFRDFARVPSGPIALSDFYGKDWLPAPTGLSVSRGFEFSSAGTNYNLFKASWGSVPSVNGYVLSVYTYESNSTDYYYTSGTSFAISAPINTKVSFAVNAYNYWAGYLSNWTGYFNSFLYGALPSGNSWSYWTGNAGEVWFQYDEAVLLQYQIFVNSGGSGVSFNLALYDSQANLIATAAQGTSATIILSSGIRPANNIYVLVVNLSAYCNDIQIFTW